MPTRLPSATEQLLPISKHSRPAKQTKVIGRTHSCLVTSRGSQQRHQPNFPDSRFNGRLTMAPDAWDVRGPHEAQPDWMTELRWNPVTLWTRQTETNTGWRTTHGLPGSIHLERLTANTRRTGYGRTVTGKVSQIFARQRLDKGMNNDFRINLTRKQHDEPVYAQCLPTPTNLKDEMLVELGF